MIRYIGLDDLGKFEAGDPLVFLEKKPLEIPYAKLEITVIEKEERFIMDRKPEVKKPKKKWWNLGK